MKRHRITIDRTFWLAVALVLPLAYVSHLVPHDHDLVHHALPDHGGHDHHDHHGPGPHGHGHGHAVDGHGDHHHAKAPQRASGPGPMKGLPVASVVPLAAPLAHASPPPRGGDSPDPPPAPSLLAPRAPPVRG